ncbi:MAG: hypothetical protein ACKO7W_00345 [Elainella sp.]
MKFKAAKSPAARQALGLGLLLLLGLALRFWQLDSKPLWLDEVLTALFTTGHTMQSVPLQVFFPLTALDTLFQYQPGLSCAEIAQRVSVESVHPPLFFCLLYGWLGWLRPQNWSDSWVWAMRALPALWGVAAIAASYWLNRLAFSPRAGLLAAALMAVSPFAVYLSQEARHYTLPMLLITLALAVLVQIQQRILAQKLPHPALWLAWIGLNLLGLYTHYFCLLALIAQVTALAGWMLGRRVTGRQVGKQNWLALLLSLGFVGLGYLPWLPTLVSHFNRPETDWLIPYKPDWLDRLEPLYQTLIGWTLMVVALPVEDQPDAVAIGSSLVILGFMLWFIWQLRGRARRLWQNLTLRPAVILIAGFTGCILLQFFAIVYLLNKDLTAVPRYNFVYYPGVCALLSACLSAPLATSLATSLATPAPDPNSVQAIRRVHPALVVLAVGLISSLFVGQGLVFQKSYHPDRVAQNMAFEPQFPLATVMTYRSPQEVALGLSFALALKQQFPDPELDRVRFAFLVRSEGLDSTWRTLAQLEQPLPPPLNLWIVAAPGMRTGDYPARLTLNAPPTPTSRARMRCLVDPDQLYRQGFPYQLFRCQPLPKPTQN